MKILSYDHTFEGFLTCVFAVYEQKIKDVKIIPKGQEAATFFETPEYIRTEDTLADRVWKGLKKQGSPVTVNHLYRCFLSELEGVENLLLNYIRKLFSSGMSISNYADPDVLSISKIVKMVNREKHRMDAFVRFRETRDSIYFATIEPDFNVLPLNAMHFKNRYADQKWLIYDLKRSYGLYYDMNTVETVQLEIDSDVNKLSKATIYFTEREHQYETLWQNYFQSTNIKSRKNMRLHIRHIPKRYWKYLSEKRPF